MGCPARVIELACEQRSLSAAYADVGESGLAVGVGVEQVAGVDDSFGVHRVGDLVDFDPAELVPFGEHDDGVGTFAGGVRVAADVGGRKLADRGVDRRVVGTNRCPFLDESLSNSDRRGVTQVIGAGFEGEAPDGQGLAGD